MTAQTAQTDYFSINTTKIYSVNPGGTFTVTSLPLTSRHLQDLESPSYYNLLFDLIANKFSKAPLHRRSAQQITTPFKTSTKLGGSQRPTLSTTKSANAVLTPQRCEHQQDYSYTKDALKSLGAAGPRTPVPNQLQDLARRQQRLQISPGKAADVSLASLGHERACNSPHESPSQIAATSVGALLTLPEHTHHDHITEEHHQPPPTSANSAEVILPRLNTTLGSLPKPQVNATKLANRLLSVSLGCLSRPSKAMAQEHPHHPHPDSPDPFTAFGNPHQDTTLSPQQAGILSIRNARKEARIQAAKNKAEQKQKERADKAAKKIERENAEAAKRAEREQRQGAEMMRKLEKEAEKQRLRREEQAASMEKKRRWEEEKERVVEVRRHERALGGMSWGFDPGAGTRASRESAGGSGEVTAGEEGHTSGDSDGLGVHRVTKETTWGVTGGGPGRIGGFHGSDVNKR